MCFGIRCSGFQCCQAVFHNRSLFPSESYPQLLDGEEKGEKQEKEDDRSLCAFSNDNGDRVGLWNRLLSRNTNSDNTDRMGLWNRSLFRRNRNSVGMSSIHRPSNAHPSGRPLIDSYWLS